MLDLPTAKAILGTEEIAGKIATLAGVLESIEGKLDLLLETPLNAALHMLDDARDSVNVEDRKRLLEAARTKFYEAAQLEGPNTPRQALALFALSACHFWLDGGAAANRDKGLNAILQLNPLANARGMPKHAVDFLAKLNGFVASFFLGILLTGIIIMFSAFTAYILGIDTSVEATGITEKMRAMALVGLVVLLVMFFILSKGLKPTEIALQNDIDVRKTTKLQLVVADILQKPVPWLQAEGIAVNDRQLQGL